MRQFLPVANVLGFVLVIFACSMLVPLTVSWWLAERIIEVHVEAFLTTALAGLALFALTWRLRRELHPRDGYLLVSLVWTVLPAFATLPLLLALPSLSFTDAYFETMSGMTTTGATVLDRLDTLPASLNVWRCFLVWLGGMGILVLAVAILPLLGVGGSQVLKAETPGPMKDAKLTPRIAQTAKGLYAVYVGISVACVLAFRWAGMSWLDAFCHAFSTMGLGGFSTHDESFGYFKSPAIEAVTVVFMLLAGMNFAVHFSVWRARSLAPYRHCPEARWFLGVTLGATLLIALYLLQRGTYPEFATALRHALFNTVSIATTTGFASVDYSTWPMFAPVLLILLSCFATCAGSTGGGIKMLRALVLLKQARRELVRVLHPRAINPVTIAGGAIENNVIFSVLAFMLLYGGLIIGATMLMLFSGLDVVTAFTAVMACINNMGPGLNQVGPATNYAVLTDLQTWVCTVTMLLGRLELFTVLVLFTRTFWRK